MRNGIRVTAFLPICSLGFGSIPALAATLATEDALNASVLQGDERARLQALRARGDVQASLQRHGVDPGQAAARVAAMSDDDVRLLQKRLDSLPAGGDVVGVLVFLFLALVVTDLLGVTDVFPFIQPIR